MTRKESIRIEYKPLSTSDSVATLSGNQRQAYDVNSGYFNPDRRLDPLTLLVTCAVMDAHNLVNGVVNESLTDIRWKITDSTTGKLVPILATDKQFKIGVGADKGKITIYKNIPDLEETTIEFTARYIEPKSKRVAVFQRTFSLVTVTEATAPALLKLTAPVGTVQFPFVNDKGLVLQADLLREGKKVPAAYYWKKDGKDLTEKTDKLVVTDASKAGNVFQVEVADCTAKFNELVADKVEADAEVKEWRGLYESEDLNIMNITSLIENNIDHNNYVEKHNLKTINAASWAKTIFDNIWVFQKLRPNKQYNLEYYIEVIEKPKEKSSSQATAEFYLYSAKNNQGYEMGRVDPSEFDLLKVGDVVHVKSSFKTPVNLNDFKILLYTSSHSTDKGNIRSVLKFYDIKLSELSNKQINWSPAKEDLSELLKEKTEFYADQTSLPVGYRPNPKPTALYKKEIFLKRSLGDYEVEILYPKVVDPDADAVQFEAVFTNNKGSIPDSAKWFDVGWWKKADGSYEYKGLKIKVPMAKLQTFIAAGKGVEYTVIEK